MSQIAPISSTVQETLKNLLHVDYYVIIVILDKYIREIMQSKCIIYLIQILLAEKIVIYVIKLIRELCIYVMLGYYEY